MRNTEHMRKHGFETPFHPLQVISWFIFSIDALLCGLFMMPSVQDEIVFVIYSVIIWGSLFGTVILTVATMLIDPRDPAIDGVKCEEEQIFECSSCDCMVGSRTKHCRVCDKCVSVFDHHCNWLNTCIGQRNYLPFFCLICFVFVFTTSMCVFSIHQIILVALATTKATIFNGTYLQGKSEHVVYGVGAVLVFINSILTVFVAQLISLHVFLIINKLTTYEYIMLKIQRTKEIEIAPEKSKDTCLDWIVFQKKKRNESSHESLEEASSAQIDNTLTENEQEVLDAVQPHGAFTGVSEVRIDIKEEDENDKQQHEDHVQLSIIESYSIDRPSLSSLNEAVPGTENLFHSHDVSDRLNNKQSLKPHNVTNERGRSFHGLSEIETIHQTNDDSSTCSSQVIGLVNPHPPDSEKRTARDQKVLKNAIIRDEEAFHGFDSPNRGLYNTHSESSENHHLDNVSALGRVSQSPINQKNGLMDSFEEHIHKKTTVGIFNRPIHEALERKRMPLNSPNIRVSPIVTECYEEPVSIFKIKTADEKTLVSSSWQSSLPITSTPRIINLEKNKSVTSFSESEQLNNPVDSSQRKLSTLEVSLKQKNRAILSRQPLRSPLYNNFEQARSVRNLCENPFGIGFASSSRLVSDPIPMTPVKRTTDSETSASLMDYIDSVRSHYHTGNM
eukprot:GDKJ01019364.1.p1 GENE.GDKJ01019364.1~~GDKJ01019364.1.p1  ORF type:complete len:673 (+),score=99.69 GDKJ01019364.1:48-2066(+)